MARIATRPRSSPTRCRCSAAAAVRAAAVAAVTKAVTAAATVVAAAAAAASRRNAAAVPAAHRAAVRAVQVAARAVRARRQAAASTRWTTIFRSDFPYPRNVKINPAFWWGFFFIYLGFRAFLDPQHLPEGYRGGRRFFADNAYRQLSVLAILRRGLPQALP
ncbi:exported hypothetical protein [Burkholderia vietnamiensis]|nr:exported hypothetical protein [Burkholderia vietnamiensis]